MKKTWLISVAAAGVAVALSLLTPHSLPAQPAGPAAGAPAQGGAGGRGGRGGLQVDAAAMEALYAARCQGCHAAAERAPSRADFRQRTADNVIEVLTNGAMKTMAEGLTTAQIRELAVHLTGRQVGEALPVPINDVKCARSGPINATPASWTKIAVDPQNTAFHRNSGLRAADVPRLKLKWAFSYRASTYGQATVVGDRLFITSGSGGGFYSLDAKTGCVHYRVDTMMGPDGPVPFSSRSTPAIINRPGLSPSGWITFFSGPANRVYAFDPQDGRQLWRSEPVETIGASRLTGTPALHGDSLFVPVSGAEEGRSSGPCCTFRGSLVALDAKTGARKWQTYFIQEPMRPTRKNSQGVQLQGPAGAASWSSPTIDAKRNQVYVTTGNSYTDGDTTGADAVIAIDMTTGAIKWTNQTYPNDNFLVGCNRPPASGVKAPNCPLADGPDYDYGASAVLVTMPNGRDIVVSGQKSGVVHAMDPDTGRPLWQNKVGAGSSLGGIEWGIATDGRYVFAPNSDMIRQHELALQAAGQMVTSIRVPTPQPGLTAIDLMTGRTVWHYATPEIPCKWAPGTSRNRLPGCFHSQSQAVSVIPGVVFSGSTNGWFRAHATNDGKVLWQYDTTGQTYDTINGVKGQPGGSLDSMAASISDGVVYVMSGYGGSAGVGNNNPNVLLAFSVDGK